MAVLLSPLGGVAAQFFDNSGNPLSGGLIYTYAAGTSTPQATYTTGAGNIQQPNPIVLDAAGRVPTGEIWLEDGEAYKFVIKTSASVQINSYDNIVGINSNFVNFVTSQEVQTATQGQTVFTLTTMQYQPGTNNLQVIVNGSVQIVTLNYVETSSTVVTFNSGLNVGDVVEFTSALINSGSATDASQVSFTGFNGQVGTVESLANGTGSDWIGFTQSGTNAVARSAQDKMRDFASVKDFGAKGDGVTNDTLAIQNAVTAVCGSGKTLLFPAGGYLIDAPITFPNTSFIIQGEGPTATYIKSFNPSASTDLFDFTGTTGGAKVVKNISFQGPALSNYGTGAGIKASTNGLYLDNVWFRGILYGLKATGSYVNTNQCVAEYCYVGASCTSALNESIWYGWTMFKNETDFSLAGSNETFIVRDSTCIGTKTDVVLVDSGVIVDGVVVQDALPSTGYSPNIIHLYGSNNIINNVTTSNYGVRGIFLEGSGVTGNKITNVTLSGLPNGILFSQASQNNLNNITITGSSSGYGIYFDTALNNTIENFTLSGNKYGIQISAASNNCLYNGVISSSVTSDFYFPVVNTSIIFISNVNANFTGIASLPYKISILSNGQNQISANAAPTTLTWNVGDITINSTPAVGQPKGWMCTVAGTPGTWVSQGNL